MKTVLLKILMGLTAAAWVTSLVIHVRSLNRIEIPSWAMSLHVGVILMVAAAIFARAPRISRAATLTDCPRGLRWFVVANFLYAIGFFVFFYFVNLTHSSTPLDLSTYSGHWLAFYAYAFAIFYSAEKP
jgi:hypothetical protein